MTVNDAFLFLPSGFGAGLIAWRVIGWLRTSSREVRELQLERLQLATEERCVAAIRLIREAGLTTYMSEERCPYCERRSVATLWGPKRVVTPMRETIVQKDKCHGVVCLWCGVRAAEMYHGIREAGPLPSYLERECVTLTRAFYEAELEHLEAMASGIRAKRDALPLEEPYRSPQALPRAKAEGEAAADEPILREAEVRRV